MSQLKTLDFKNLDRDKKKVCLDSRENLDRFQKLISTDRDVLTVETPKLRNNTLFNFGSSSGAKMYLYFLKIRGGGKCSQKLRTERI